MQDILGKMKASVAQQRSSGAAGQRGSGAAEQRSSGTAELRQNVFCVGQRDGARQKLVGIKLNEISERASNVHFVLSYP